MPGQRQRNQKASSGRTGEWTSANTTTLTPIEDKTITRGHNQERSDAALLRGWTFGGTSVSCTLSSTTRPHRGRLTDTSPGGHPARSAYRPRNPLSPGTEANALYTHL